MAYFGYFIDDFHKKELISLRTRNALLRAKIKDISQLLPLTESEIKKLPGLGKSTLTEVENLIKLYKKNQDDFIDSDPDSFASEELKSKFNDKLSLLENYSLKELHFSTRTKNCLEKEKINSLFDLLSYSLIELKNIDDFGAQCANEIVSFLDKNNLSLGYDMNSFKSKVSSNSYLIDFPQEILNLERIHEPSMPALSQRDETILNLWNDEVLTLEAIAKRFDLTRERIRQILVSLERKGFEVLNGHQRRERKRERKRKEVLKLSESFIELYKKNLKKSIIYNRLGLSNSEYNWLEKKLVAQNKIDKRLVDGRRVTEISPEIKNRRDMILKFKAKKMTIDQIALQLGVSKPTVMNDIRKMKLSGIDVPFTRKSGGSLSEEEIEFRKAFIQDRMNEGWSRKEISNALGFDVHGFIRRFMFMDK